jgi:RNA polymerase sigma factor (TIGR02999 family)
MCSASSPGVKELLAKWCRGDAGAREALIPLVYDELRRIAHRQLWRQRADHTLRSGALVNEAYLRLVHQQSPHWQNRPHFFAVAAQMMRQILVDYARSRLAAKRGAGVPRATLDTKMVLPQSKNEQTVDLIALDDALNKLAEVDPRQSRVIELRFLAGSPLRTPRWRLGFRRLR